jgi:hypothetical protein
VAVAGAYVPPGLDDALTRAHAGVLLWLDTVSAQTPLGVHRFDGLCGRDPGPATSDRSGHRVALGEHDYVKMAKATHPRPCGCQAHFSVSVDQWTLPATRFRATRTGHDGSAAPVGYGGGVCRDGGNIVTLDRVVCCYRGVDELVTASAARARGLYGLDRPEAQSGDRAHAPMDLESCAAGDEPVT